MKKKKKWNIIDKFTVDGSRFTVENFVNFLLANRNITIPEDVENFLHPKLESVTPESVNIDPHELAQALSRIQKAFDEKEDVVIFGDYDVDGITGTAILWETLHAMGANVLPYIPHRTEEGYGLSKIAISNLLEK